MHCKKCGTTTKHKPFKTSLFKYNGEKVKTCKRCGHLRTQSQRKISEAEMVHVPSQTKYKNMGDE